MSIPEAVKQLKADLAGEGFYEGLIEEVADEYELNPKLLARKFEEQFGAAPSQYEAPKKVELSAEPAKKLARETYEKRGYYGGTDTCGVEFDNDGRRAVSVAWESRGHVYIDVETREIMITRWTRASGRDKALTKFIQTYL